MAKAATTEHAEWLSLIEVSGPFLTLPVLARALPQGLEADDSEHAKSLAIALAELGTDETLVGRWVRWVLEHSLGYPGDCLVEASALPASLTHRVAEHGLTLSPELAVLEEDEPRMLIDVWPTDQSLDGRVLGDTWTASPRDRLAELLRATGVRLGLATNGYTWTLVSAKQGESTGFATWDAELWLEERVTLRAFRTVFSVERTLGAPAGETLEDLLDRSSEAQQEVTDQLGKQVRFAIELLVHSLDRADQDRGGELLGKVSNEELYLAAVTVMMRLVFLFTAEERGLLPLSDPLYADSYAASTVRAQLQEEADRHSEEPLERRSSAWHRLLATFGAVHLGIRHDQLLLPPHGGKLFDPERFPFLEGRDRAVDDAGRSVAEPLPIDDRTVLHILDALQLLHAPGSEAAGAQRLSYRALDVEQIGHVYEGLLDHTAVRTTAPALGLAGRLEPETSLAEIERRAEVGKEALSEWLAAETGRGAKAIANRLSREPDPDSRARLLAACGGDESLCERVAPYHALVRTDLRGYPTVFLAGSVYVTRAGERRSSGTYYTTRALAEEVVKHALDPLAHDPGPAEEADPAKWKLKSPSELLELKVCDMAMGSGAFLVAACRYLADRLLDAWEKLGDGSFTVMGSRGTATTADQAIPTDPEERAIVARRLVADRCLYGVDKNPMAVDMAKLSLWLVTMAKDRPFSFLDHALLAGDSLLGVTDLRQIEHFHIDPERGAELHGTLFDYTAACGDAVAGAISKRRALEEFTALDIRDAERKARLNREAAESLGTARLLADLVIGSALATAEQGHSALETALVSIENQVKRALADATPEGERTVLLSQLRDQAERWLDAGRPAMAPPRRCFHWALELPEVFADDRRGFDAFVGNPPFQGGKKISGANGTDFREHLVTHIASGHKGNADLAAYFFLRAADIARSGGNVGLLGTNTISQGDTREVGLHQLCTGQSTIYRAAKSRPWPGEAALHVAHVWFHHGKWLGAHVLDGHDVRAITSSLDPEGRVKGEPLGLSASHGKAFVGSFVNGLGFVLDVEEANSLLRSDSRNEDVVFPYINGEDLNSRPDCSPGRWIINFFDWPLERAESYRDCFRVVQERVKPHRDGLKNKPREKRFWWRFERRAVDLYKALSAIDRAIAVATVSKHLAVAFVPTDLVFAHALVVFPWDDDRHFGWLSSQIHFVWATTRSGTLESRPTYHPSDCFETFPQPVLDEAVGDAGRHLNEHRRELMVARQEGLTKTYNRLHDPDEMAEDIAELRRLHVALDYTVRDAYGWDDLELGHGFRETQHGIRYAFEPGARIEILDRLLELNQARYDEEVKAGLHGKKGQPVQAGAEAAPAQGSLL